MRKIFVNKYLIMSLFKNYSTKSCKSTQKASNPVKKLPLNMNNHFCEESIQLSNRHMKRISSLTNRKKTNQNHNEISLHTQQNPYYQTTNNKCWQRRGEKKPSYTVSAATAKSRQSCLTLCDPIDSTPPGSSIPGILKARVLEWVAIAFSTCIVGGRQISAATIKNKMEIS